jgi:transcription antitermination factor NusG
MPKKKLAEPVRILLKKNDQVKVIAGRDAGKTGRVLDVNPANGTIRGVQREDLVPAVRAGAYRAPYGNSAGR